MPTLRLYVLLLLVTPGLALGGTFGGAALLMVTALLGAALVDGVLAGRDLRRVTARREVEDKLSLGAWNPVRLVIGNRTGRATRVEVRDIAPFDFGLTLSDPDLPAKGFARRGAPGSARAPRWARRLGESWRTRRETAGEFPVWLPEPVPPGGEAALVYRVRPIKRGDYAFGHLYLRMGGPLGLARRQKQVAGSPRAVRVYPNLRDLKKYDLLARRGLLLEAGQRAIRVAGASTEFERLREYVPDDEFRRINWKATARRGKPIVNQLEAERSQNLVIMLDAGRLMAARVDQPASDEAEVLTEGESTTGLTKLDHALNAGLLLAYVASLRGDRVALLGYTDSVRAWVPPARGRRAFVNMVGGLYNLSAEPVEADHGLAFGFLSGRNLRRSLVVLFTDLADRESSRTLLARLTHASRHHQVVCVTLSDPHVDRPARALPSDVQSLYEKMVAQRLLDDRAAALGILTHQGVVSLDVNAEALSPTVVSTYLQLKQRGRV